MGGILTALILIIPIRIHTNHAHRRLPNDDKIFSYGEESQIHSKTYFRDLYKASAAKPTKGILKKTRKYCPNPKCRNGFIVEDGQPFDRRCVSCNPAGTEQKADEDEADHLDGDDFQPGVKPIGPIESKRAQLK